MGGNMLNLPINMIGFLPGESVVHLLVMVVALFFLLTSLRRQQRRNARKAEAAEPSRIATTTINTGILSNPHGTPSSGIVPNPSAMAAAGTNISPVPSPSLSPLGSPLASKEGQKRLRHDLEVLIGELQDLSRKISADIDTRFTKLETVMRDADRRIAVLNRLSRGMSEQEANRSGHTLEGDIRYAVVYELADAGFSPIDIARDLGKTPGEVELILNLRRTAYHR